MCQLVGMVLVSTCALVTPCLYCLLLLLAAFVSCLSLPLLTVFGCCCASGFDSLIVHMVLQHLCSSLATPLFSLSACLCSCLLFLLWFRFVGCSLVRLYVVAVLSGSMWLQVYDIKGSTHGRITQDVNKKVEGVVLKDLDLGFKVNYRLRRRGRSKGREGEGAREGGSIRGGSRYAVD